jgi:hypothetical protein
MCTGRCTPKESPQGLHTYSPQLPMQDVPADDTEVGASARSRLLNTAPVTTSPQMQQHVLLAYK